MFCVKLIDVSPDDSNALVARGVLNVTHRDSHSCPKEIVPGEIYELDISLEPCSYIFGEGHSIRISIASADFPILWPMPKAARNTIYFNSEHPSRVCLPMVQTSDPLCEAPNFRKPPDVSNLPGSTEPTSWVTTRDLLEDTITVAVSFGGDTSFPDERLAITTHANMEITTDWSRPDEA